MSYAVPTILGELERHFRDTGWAVRVPRGPQELALQVDTTAQRMSENLGRSPEIDELSAVPDATISGGGHHLRSVKRPAARSDFRGIEP